MTMVDSTRVVFNDGITEPEVEQLSANPSVKVLQCSAPVSNETWDRLNTCFFLKRPDVELRVWGHYSSTCDLRFAERMTNVRRFAADRLMQATNVEFVSAIPQLESLSLGIFDLEDFSVLERVSSGLTELSLGASRSKKPNLAPLARFGSLRTLYIEGHSKSIEVLGSLPALTDLTLRSVTTEDLRYLAPLKSLRSLDIKLGGIGSFAGIEGKMSLKYLELWQIRGLSDVGIIAKLPGLQNMFMQSLARMAAIPSLKEAACLRRIILENIKALSDFTSLERAPALEEFGLIDGSPQQPAHLLPVLRNPSVRRVSAGFGSVRKNDEFAAMVVAAGKAKLDPRSAFEYR